MKSISFVLIIMLSLNIQSMNNPYISTDSNQLKKLPKKPPVTENMIADGYADGYKDINTKDDHMRTQLVPSFPISNELGICLAVISTYIFITLFENKLSPSYKFLNIDQDDETIDTPRCPEIEHCTIIDIPNQSDE